MKNIHLLLTSQPSRLRYNLSNVLALTKEPYRDYSKQVNQQIYITSDVEDINENNYIITKDGKLVHVSYFLSKDLEDASKVILTTDQDLIKDGVQAINDEFLEWFVKNPSCEFVEVSYEVLKPFQSIDKGYILRLPDTDVLEEPKQETLEEAADNWSLHERKSKWGGIVKNSFKAGAKWQAKTMYSEEDMHKLMDDYQDYLFKTNEPVKTFKQWFEQFKKK